jgi:hypothetical protein
VNLERGTRVTAIEAVGEIEEGDTGSVIARWMHNVVTVRWDKDNQPRRIHRKRLVTENGEGPKSLPAL